MPTTPATPLTTLSTRRRAAHPSSHPAGQGLVEPTDLPLSFSALRVIAAGLARVQAPVPPDVEQPTGARSVRLLATSAYDVWLITWPDGSALGPHDHGGARSVTQVVDGEIVEIVGGRSAERATARVLRRGESFGHGGTDVHELANWSGADATTLHIYSPPLADVTFAERPSDGEPVRWRRRPVARRRAQASTGEVHPELAVVHG